MPATTPVPRPEDPLCAFCGAEVPLMAAIVYHGVVYHPACVAPTTGQPLVPDSAAVRSQPSR